MHTFPIAVKPYVRKFLMARYRPDDGVWEVNKQERIGKVLYSMLDRMPVRYEKSKLNYGAEIRIGICQDYVVRKGVHLSNDSVIEFNDFIQMEIVEQIAMYCYEVKNRVGLKKYKELYVKHNRTKSPRIHVVRDPDLFQYLEKKEIVYDILKIYDITEDDFPFDTVFKACQRLKLPLLTA